MGMFDLVVVESDNQLGLVDGVYQTKDLDCVMAKLTIKRDGRLIVHRDYRSYHGGEIEQILDGDFASSDFDLRPAVDEFQILSTTSAEPRPSSGLPSYTLLVVDSRVIKVLGRYES